MKISKQKLQQIIQEELQEMVDEGEMDEGFLDRTKARVQGAFAGASGAVQQGVAGAKGAFKQGAMGLAQKGLGALGAGAAAAEVGTAKDAAQKATAQQQQNIGNATSDQQASVKFNAAVSPKVTEIEKDIKALFGDNAPRMKQVNAALNQLKQAVAAVAQTAQKSAQTAGAKGGEVQAPNQPVPPGGVPGFKPAPAGRQSQNSTSRVPGR